MDASKWRWQALGALAVALVACLFLIVVTISRYGYNPSALLWLGEETAASYPRLLGAGIVVMKDSPGYDGQLLYFIAQDPFLQRRDYTEAGRYSRIGYPLLATNLALGQRDLLPYSLILVNVLAMLGGIYLLQRMLQPLGQSPWLSLLIGLNSGNLLSLQHDLSDALALTLGVGAIFSYQRGRLGWAVWLLAAALLTRESAILFMITLVLWEVGQRRFRGPVALSLALLPYALFQLYLWAAVGEVGVFAPTSRIVAPFSGMVPVVAQLGELPSLGAAVHPLSVILVMALMVSALAFSLWSLARRPHLFAWGILVQALFAICASYGIWEGYASAGRVFAGIYPFLILSHATRPERSSRALLAFSALLSLLTLLRPFFTPAGAYYIT